MVLAIVGAVLSATAFAAASVPALRASRRMPSLSD